MSDGFLRPATLCYFPSKYAGQGGATGARSEDRDCAPETVLEEAEVGCWAGVVRESVFDSYGFYGGRICW